MYRWIRSGGAEKRGNKGGKQGQIRVQKKQKRGDKWDTEGLKGGTQGECEEKGLQGGLE